MALFAMFTLKIVGRPAFFVFRLSNSFLFKLINRRQKAVWKLPSLFKASHEQLRNDSEGKFKRINSNENFCFDSCGECILTHSLTHSLTYGPCHQ